MENEKEEDIQSRLEIQLYFIAIYAKMWKEADKDASNIHTLFCNYIYTLVEANNTVEDCDFNELLLEELRKRTEGRDLTDDVVGQFYNISIELIKSSVDYEAKMRK